MRTRSQSSVRIFTEQYTSNKATLQWLRATCTGLLALLLCTCSAGLLAQQNLPDMGEPSDNALSPQQEKRLGRSYMRQIRARLPLVLDTQSNEFLQNLGRRLAASVQYRGSGEFNFFIIDDPAINAFAIPGGYVGVNAGLIAAMTREEQLAGVVAHEIAHVTQRHHARSYETAGRNRMSTAAAIFAALLIGASNAEAGQAALAAGLAISQQTAINYTRSHEYEADRIGIRILADADYDPAAIAETFEILRKKNSINTSGAEIEYLRTHPLDSNRIAEAKSRAAQLPGAPTSIPQLDFQIFKARLSILTSRDDGGLLRHYNEEYRREKSAGATYALALLATRANDYTKASRYLDNLLQLHPENPNLQLLLARIQAGRGDIYKSESTYEQLVDIYPSNYSIIEQYATQMANRRKLTKAASIIREYQRSVPLPNTDAWKELANIQQKLGDRAGSHESLARYFIERFELERAEQQLQLGLRVVNSGTQDELRLRAQLRDIEQQIRMLRQ